MEIVIERRDKPLAILRAAEPRRRNAFGDRKASETMWCQDNRVSNGRLHLTAGGRNGDSYLVARGSSDADGKRYSGARGGVGWYLNIDLIQA